MLSEAEFGMEILSPLPIDSLGVDNLGRIGEGSCIGLGKPRPLPASDQTVRTLSSDSSEIDAAGVNEDRFKTTVISVVITEAIVEVPWIDVLGTASLLVIETSVRI